MTIRPYIPTDFDVIKDWAAIDPGQSLSRESLSPTTFIAMTEGNEMAGSVSVFLTNSKHYALVEGLYTNPELTVRVRKEAIHALVSYVELFVKALEYTGLFGLPLNRAMERHVEALGFNVIHRGVSTMYKSIGGQNG